MKDELVVYTERALEAVSPLLMVSKDLLAAAGAIAPITDDEALREANELKSDINSHTKTVKELRLRLTRPVDEFKTRMTDKEKEILWPVEEAKGIVGRKILDYEEELENRRQAEIQRITALCLSFDKLYRPGMIRSQIDTAKTAAKTLMAEMGDDANIPTVKSHIIALSNNLAQRLQDIEVEENRAKKVKLQNEQAKIDEEKRQLAAETARQEVERAQIEADKEAARVAAARPKSNIIETTEFEIIDENEVDRLLCSPDLRKIREYHKAYPDMEIAGVRIIKSKKVR